MTVVAGYIGWLGHQNLGDEALYESFRRLFPDLELVDKRFISWAESKAWDDMTFWTFEKREG